MDKTDLITKINNLNLPNDVTKFILKDQSFAEYLVEEKEKYPFPANYIPQEIEIRFNNILYLKMSDNQEIFSKECSNNMKPKFIEWRFDDECAYFQTSTEIIIDRTINLVNFDNLKEKSIFNIDKE